MSALTTLRHLALAGLLLLLCRGAPAGGRLPCTSPHVFDEAAVSLLVLPYRYGTGTVVGIDSPASRLAMLVQQEALFGMLKYGSVGATELTAEGTEVCDVSRVIAQVTQGSGRGSVRPGHGLVVIWGRVYQEGGDLFVQSYLRFLRRDRRETFDISLPGPDGAALQLTAPQPQQAVAFAPRRVSIQDLDAITRAARDALMLYDANGKPVGPLAASPYEPLAYGVFATRPDGWMEVQSMAGKRGWIRARSESPEWSLRRFLPELSYLDAVVGWLRLRAAGEVPLTNSPQAQFDAVDQGFARYEQAVGADATPEAAALGRMLRASLLWNVAGPLATPQARQKAAGLYTEARERLPESAAARALAAVTTPWHQAAPAASREMLGRIAEGLVDALAVDGSEPTTLANLERVLRYASATPDASPYDAAELARRLQIVTSARASPAPR